MRHPQRALLVLLERMFFDEDVITDEERAELEDLRLESGEVKEVFRTFLQATFGADVVTAADRRRLLAIAHRLRLPEELVPEITLERAA